MANIFDLVGTRVGELFFALDKKFYYLVNNASSDFTLFFYKSISQIFDTNVILIFSAILVIALFHKKKHKLALMSFIAIGGTAVSGFMMKEIFDITRPQDRLVEVTTASFPSGHAMMITIIVMIVLYLYYLRRKDIFRRTIFTTLGVIIVVLVCLSRLYLNVHWISDIVGGVSLAMIWFGVSVMIKNRLLLKLR